MQTKTCARAVIVGLSVLAASVGWQAPGAAQDAGEAASPQVQAPVRPVDTHNYYVDFRSRTAASNDHGRRNVGHGGDHGRHRTLSSASSNCRTLFNECPGDRVLGDGDDNHNQAR